MIPNDLPDDHLDVSSTTAVNLSEGHCVGAWGGPRVVVSFRCDKKLAEWFKSHSERVYGSICRAFEALMLAHYEAELARQDEEVYLGRTERRVVIKKLVVERNLRPRRLLDPTPKPPKCEVKACDSEESAVCVVTWKNGKRFKMCEACAAKYGAMGCPVEILP